MLSLFDHLVGVIADDYALKSLAGFNKEGSKLEF